ncbi:MAG: 2-hydroxyacyl-CoA dehydratase [Vulcanimicrobiaceae bacterium]
MAIQSTVSFEELIEECNDAIATIDFADAQAWKNEGHTQALIGCFPVYTPVELFHAAGALPVGLTGAGNKIEISHADSRFQSFICSIIKSTLELAMIGNLDAFDGFVFHSICDPARNLASVFARTMNTKQVEYIHFPQRIPSYEAVVYLEAEYRRILAWACTLTGRSVTDEDLRRSIALYDAVRSAIGLLYDVRRNEPHKLSTLELYALVRYGHVAPPEKHLRILEHALEYVRARGGTPKDRARVVVVGSFCEQPPMDLIASIEQAGCYVVDDDFLLGRRFFTGGIADTGNPLYDLADAYVHGSVDSSVKHDLGHSKALSLVQRARDHRADAVVVLTAKFCEPALFDYVLYRKALQEAHMPHVFLEFEEKMWLFDKIKTELETFVESLLFS